MTKSSNYRARKRIISWQSLVRNYAIWHYIRHERVAEFINQMDGIFVLDVGCGEGFLDFLLVNKVVTGVDVSSEKVEKAKQIERMLKTQENTVYSFLVADLHHLPFKKKFDMVVCTEVLEHLSDDKKALRAISSIMKKDGFLVITLPNSLRLDFRSSLRPRQKFMHPDHIREYQVNNIQNLVKSLPLKIIKISGIYFEFPFFHLLFIPTFLSKRKMLLPITLRFLLNNAFFQVYMTLWGMLRTLFWYRSYYILVICKKV